MRFIMQRRDLLTLSAASTIFGALQLVLSSFLVIYLVSVVGYDLVSGGSALGVEPSLRCSGTHSVGLFRGPHEITLEAADTGRDRHGCRVPPRQGYRRDTGPSGIVFPVVILFGATASGWNGVLLAEVMREVKPAEVGFATSGSLVFTYVGVVIGPALFGAAAAPAGFQSAYALAAGMGLVGAFLAFPFQASPSTSSGRP